MKWIQRRVDHVVVILPFEPELYRRAGVRCTFVGHPLLDTVAPHYDRAKLRREFGLDESSRVVGLLPGSRVSEVEMLLPVLLKAAAQLVVAEPGTQFILAQASSIDDNLIQALLQHSPVPVRVVHDQASEVMALSEVLFIASGTATLQAAVVGTPMVLLYKTSPLTYRLARWLINVKWIGLVNLVAGRSVVPELIQDEATAERLCQEVLHLLRDPSAYNDMKEGLRQVRQSLGNPAPPVELRRWHCLNVDSRSFDTIGPLPEALSGSVGCGVRLLGAGGGLLRRLRLARQAGPRRDFHQQERKPLAGAPARALRRGGAQERLQLRAKLSHELCRESGDHRHSTGSCSGSSFGCPFPITM